MTATGRSPSLRNTTCPDKSAATKGGRNNRPQKSPKDSATIEAAASKNRILGVSFTGKGSRKKRRLKSHRGAVLMGEETWSKAGSHRAAIYSYQTRFMKT